MAVQHTSKTGLWTTLFLTVSFLTSTRARLIFWSSFLFCSLAF